MSHLESRPTTHVTADAVRDAIARAVAVVGLAGFALIHLLDLPDTMSGSQLLGWAYIAAIVGAVAAAGALIRTSDTRVWLAAAGLVTSVIVAYVLSRTTGIPQDSDDIGNWGQSLGIAMLFDGGALLALTGGVLTDRRRSAHARLRSRRPLAVVGRPDAARSQAA
jgi:Na+/proline symporter